MSLQELTINVAGVTTRILRDGRAGGPATMFLHGGIPGVTPFCSGTHIWGNSLARFLEDRDTIVPDLPGSGGTLQASGPLTVDVLARHVVDLMSALSIETVDIVGHDLGGLVGVLTALTHPARIRSLSIVASPMSAPTGDGLDSILFLSPPQPPWSRESQAWALERLSYVHTHIDAPLLDACVAASEGEAHRRAMDYMHHHYVRTFGPSVARTRYLLWETCRNNGVQVPVQIVWASHDPAVSREAGFVLFSTLARKQRAAQMHVINRAGSLPFRDQPAAFHHIVSSFQTGVLAERSHVAA